MRRATAAPDPAGLADLLDGIPGELAGGGSGPAVSPRRLPPPREASRDQADLLDATLYVAQPPAARGWALPAGRELLLTGAPPVAAALLLVLAWELFIRVRDVPIYLAPAPSRVFVTLSEDPSRFLEAGSVSAQHALGGLLLGAGSAFLLGVLMAHSQGDRACGLPAGDPREGDAGRRRRAADRDLVRVRRLAEVHRRRADHLLPDARQHDHRAAIDRCGHARFLPARSAPRAGRCCGGCGGPPRCPTSSPG